MYTAGRDKDTRRHEEIWKYIVCLNTLYHENKQLKKPQVRLQRWFNGMPTCHRLICGGVSTVAVQWVCLGLGVVFFNFRFFSNVSFVIFSRRGLRSFRIGFPFFMFRFGLGFHLHPPPLHGEPPAAIIYRIYHVWALWAGPPRSEISCLNMVRSLFKTLRPVIRQSILWHLYPTSYVSHLL